MSSTIHDVAKRADVSISTVSRVLNQTSPVAKDKRIRVEEAVSYLNYSPNPAAVSLLKGETGAIGVLLPAIGGEFFAQLLNGLDTAIQSYERILLVSPSHRSQTEFRASLRAIATRVDGLLIVAPGIKSSDISEILPTGLPIVYMNSPVDEEGVSLITFDNLGGMHSITRHLIDTGHRTIAFVGGPAGTSDAEHRRDGFRKAISEGILTDASTMSVKASSKSSGATPLKVYEIEGDFSLESGYAAAKEIVKLNPRPTAVQACNDLCAQGVLSGLLEAGIQVPGEMALAGFDDIPSAAYMTPRLTTVRVPLAEMSARALRHLITMISNAEPLEALTETMPVELVVRESTTGFA